MKYYIHKIENGRGRCVLEIEAETVAAVVSHIEKNFKTAGSYYIFSADGYTGQTHTMGGYKRIPVEEAYNLKIGDQIFIKCGYDYFPATVTRKAFYNEDADIPEWEIETNNGYADFYSIYRKR